MPRCAARPASASRPPAHATYSRTTRTATSRSAAPWRRRSAGARRKTGARRWCAASGRSTSAWPTATCGAPSRAGLGTCTTSGSGCPGLPSMRAAVRLRNESNAGPSAWKALVSAIMSAAWPYAAYHYADTGAAIALLTAEVALAPAVTAHHIGKRGAGGQQRRGRVEGAAGDGGGGLPPVARLQQAGGGNGRAGRRAAVFDGRRSRTHRAAADTNGPQAAGQAPIATGVPSSSASIASWMAASTGVSFKMVA